MAVILVTFEDLDNTYLTSPATGARVLLRQMADLEPEWQLGRIRRRNGVRTLTVRTETQLGRMPNNILAEIMPMIISGSALWAPLGAVLAVGLVFGMALTLLIMPVLYWLMLSPRDKKAGKNRHVAPPLDLPKLEQ